MAASRFPRPSIAIGHRGVIALGAALGVLSVAARFDNEQLLWFDRRIADLAYAPHHVELFRAISELGSTRFTVTLAVVATMSVWRRCRPLAVLYPTAAIGGLLANVILKVLVNRARPPDPLTGTALKSFPSGHTIQTVVALGMLAPVVYTLTGRRRAAIVTTVLAALAAAGVGLSRVALGAHWPSDIVGGVLVGILVLIAAEVALARLPTRWLRPCPDCPLHLAWGFATAPEQERPARHRCAGRQSRHASGSAHQLPSSVA